MEDETLLESIYYDREQGVLADQSIEEKKVMQEIKKVGNEEKLRQLIGKVHNKRLKKQINKFLDLTLDDISAIGSISLYKYYKQGFKDGINLLIECVR